VIAGARVRVERVVQLTLQCLIRAATARNDDAYKSNQTADVGLYVLAGKSPKLDRRQGRTSVIGILCFGVERGVDASMRKTRRLERQDAHAEREAFDQALARCFAELLQAAEREVRHRLALGHFEPDHPTPKQLLDVALQHTWRERRRLSPPLGIKALALVSIFRAGKSVGTRVARRRLMVTELLPEEVEPDPF
jgi:hypothetical protein